MRGAQVFTAFRTPRVTVRPLPPLEAYEAWWPTEHPSPRAGKVLSPRQYRRLAAMIRSGASGEEKARALGMTAVSLCRIAKRLPEHLR